MQAPKDPVHSRTISRVVARYTHVEVYVSLNPNLRRLLSERSGTSRTFQQGAPVHSAPVHVHEPSCAAAAICAHCSAELRLSASQGRSGFARQALHCHEVCRLMRSHLDKGDSTSAMVTMDWTMKNFFFQHWAFPFEQAATLYDDLGRNEEARDAARLALKQPWWTVSDLPRCVVRSWHVLL